MTNAVSEIFGTSLQKTQVWLNDVMTELDWTDRPQKAYLALRAVLHALRDRLTVEEAVQLGAQLPMLIRGLYYEGWTPKGKPHKERHEKDFLDHIKMTFRDDTGVNPGEVVRAIFRVIVRHTSAGEIEDIKPFYLSRYRSCGPNPHYSPLEEKRSRFFNWRIF